MKYQNVIQVLVKPGIREKAKSGIIYAAPNHVQLMTGSGLMDSIMAPFGLQYSYLEYANKFAPKHLADFIASYKTSTSPKPGECIRNMDITSQWRSFLDDQNCMPNIFKMTPLMTPYEPLFQIANGWDSLRFQRDVTVLEVLTSENQIPMLGHAISTNSRPLPFVLTPYHELGNALALYNIAHAFNTKWAQIGVEDEYLITPIGFEVDKSEFFGVVFYPEVYLAAIIIHCLKNVDLDDQEAVNTALNITANQFIDYQLQEINDMNFGSMFELEQDDATANSPETAS